MNIINFRNYGDLQNLSVDNKTLRDIINRQGINLIVDHLATYIGEQAIMWNWSETESRYAMNSVLNDLKEAILERV